MRNFGPHGGHLLSGHLSKKLGCQGFQYRGRGPGMAKPNLATANFFTALTYGDLYNIFLVHFTSNSLIDITH